MGARDGVRSFDRIELSIPGDENRFNERSFVGEVEHCAFDAFFAAQFPPGQCLDGCDEVIVGDLLRFPPHVNPFGEYACGVG